MTERENKDKVFQSCLRLPVNRDAGEGEDGEAADGLTEEAGRFEDAEKEQVFDFGAGLLMGKAPDDGVVVDGARAVDVGFDDNWTIDGADLSYVRSCSG